MNYKEYIRELENTVSDPDLIKEFKSACADKFCPKPSPNAEQKYNEAFNKLSQYAPELARRFTPQMGMKEFNPFPASPKRAPRLTINGSNNGIQT